MHSANDQMRAHLTNCVRIWPLLVGLTKCVAHLVKRCAFGQNSARFVNWSDAQRICPNALRIWLNAQIGQMRLTIPR